MPTEVLNLQPAGTSSPKRVQQQQPAAPNSTEIWKENVWKKEDGSVEPVIELEDEPRHHVSFVNDHTKIITIRMDPDDTTLAHRHTKDTIIVICMESGVDFVNDVMGCQPQIGRMEFGQVGFAPYADKPCVHKITNLTEAPFFVVNVEVLNKPPLTQSGILKADCHTLVKQQENCRIYKISLQPGQTTEPVTYGFFYVRVVLKGSLIQNTLKEDSVYWNESLEMGDSHWKEPCVDLSITNLGTSVFEAYICELI